MSAIPYPRYLGQFPLHCDHSGEDCYIVRVTTVWTGAPAPPPNPLGSDTYALAFHTNAGDFFVDSFDKFTVKNEP